MIRLHHLLVVAILGGATLGITAQAQEEFGDAVSDFFRVLGGDPNHDRHGGNYDGYDYDREHDDAYHGHDYKDRYIIRDGRLWILDRGDYILVRDPYDEYLRELPWGLREVRIEGELYWTRQGLWFTRARRGDGYLCVPDPTKPAWNDHPDHDRPDWGDDHRPSYRPTEPYIIRQGSLWELRDGDYRRIQDPYGIRMKQLPPGVERITARGQEWYTSQGIYLGRTRTHEWAVVDDPTRGEPIRDNKALYIIRSGRLMERSGANYAPVRDAVGTRMKKLPEGCSRVVVDGREYYTSQGVYLARIRDAWEVVDPPRRPRY